MISFDLDKLLHLFGLPTRSSAAVDIAANIAPLAPRSPESGTVAALSGGVLAIAQPNQSVLHDADAARLGATSSAAAASVATMLLGLDAPDSALLGWTRDPALASAAGAEHMLAFSALALNPSAEPVEAGEAEASIIATLHGSQAIGQPPPLHDGWAATLVERAETIAERILLAHGSRSQRDVLPAAGLPGLREPARDPRPGTVELMPQPLEPPAIGAGAVFAFMTDSTMASGIIPSAILNAAMIPGWPGPVRHVATAPADQKRRQQGIEPQDKETAVSVAEMLTHLANFGALTSLLDRAQLLMKKAAERATLLLHLAALVSTVIAVFRTLRRELAEFEEPAGTERDDHEELSRRQPLE